MQLLTPTRPAELPAEALLARLRCRRAAINLTADHGTEAPVTDTVVWVYQRLNRHLRKHLTPFLELIAMRNLVLILRYTLAGDKPPAVLMEHSLLTRSLHQLAVTTGEDEATVARLEVALSSDYPFASGLTATYQNQGPGGIEQQLNSGILQHGLNRAGNDILKGTLRYLIDMRNCLMINKLWRWQVRQAPQLSSGGILATSSLQHIWASQNSERLTRLTARLAGEPLVSTEAIGMEQCLLKGLTRFLRRAGRDPLGLAVIVEYLWIAQLAVHNQLLRKALTLDREELLEEVLLL